MVVWWLGGKAHSGVAVPNMEKSLLEIGWVDLTTGEISALIQS
jgi:hypothetical protein